MSVGVALWLLYCCHEKRPGCEVSLEVSLELTDGTTGVVSNNIAQLGHGWAWTDDCEFSLPKNGLTKAIQTLQAMLPAGASGQSRLFMKALALPCNGATVDSNEAKIEPLSTATGSAQISGTLVECARIVRVNAILEGSIVTLHSDALDGAQLSSPQRIFGPQTVGGLVAFLPCYRPLRAGESITVTETGCGGLLRTSAPTQVIPLSTLLPPVVHGPVRPFDRSVRIDKVVPGARVHVFVNGFLRASVDSAVEIFPFPDSLVVDLGDLQIKDQITARQTLCVKISALSDAADVELGRMNMRSTAPSFLRGLRA